MKLSSAIVAIVTLFLGTLGFAAAGTSATTDTPPLPPPTNQNLVLTAPIRSWDEAIPLGNGLMGGLLWGEGNTLRLSLDRGDLWDERPNGEAEWWKKRPWSTWKQNESYWDNTYNGITPTKLPGGRLELTLASTQNVKSFEMNLASAEGVAHYGNGVDARAFFSAVEPVALLRIPGPMPEINLIPAGAGKDRESGGPSSGGAVAALGYPPAKRGKSDGMQWYVQNADAGLKYCVCVAHQHIGNDTLLAIAVTSTNDCKPGEDLLTLAKARCIHALAQGYAPMLAPHAAWWKKFWQQSSLNVPEEHIQKYYQFARYLYGAGSRRGAPPMPLQGVWTADNGGLPPWKGDYHNDLNTQMTYIAYQEAGNFDEGACYLDFLWKLTPTFRAFAKDFYGTGGLAAPGVMSLAGQPLGGWQQYAMSPTMSAWNAHLFYLHWRYTGDDEFLKDRAYPWCSQVGQCMMELLKPDAHGVLVLPLSSSPEIFNNSARSWLKPNSNYDLMCLKMLFLALQEMADALDKPAESIKWADLADKLGDFHAAPDGELLLDANTPLRESHRHLSCLIGIYPFNLISIEGGPEDQKRIKTSLAMWDRLGTSQWCGYSWAWMSCLRARVGDSEAAVRDLDVFARAFVSRNGFHINGDQSGKGFSSFTYRPFTLEGNFAAMQAVHEMLLQSWSPTPGKRDTEIIRIFPATPWRWHDASFTDLYAEGGHRVSAKQENNSTTWLRVVAGKDGIVRIRDNFGGRTPTWTMQSVNKIGDNYEITLMKGQSIEATLPKPAEIPEAPSNLAEPVDIPRATSGIVPTKLPLRIGADSNGGDRFTGDMARIALFNRALDGAEITQLATKENVHWSGIKGVLVALDGEPIATLSARVIPNIAQPKLPAKIIGPVQILAADDGLTGQMFRFNGQGYLEIPQNNSLHGYTGLTLSAWVRPTQLIPSGMRIIDKSPVNSAMGYLLDTYPSNSLRLITRDPHLIFPAKLPLNQWAHVAATIDGSSGQQTLYINGKAVAQSP